VGGSGLWARGEAHINPFSHSEISIEVHYQSTHYTRTTGYNLKGGLGKKGEESMMECGVCVYQMHKMAGIQYGQQIDRTQGN